MVALGDSEVAQRRPCGLAAGVAADHAAALLPAALALDLVVVAPSRLAAMRYARRFNDFHVRAYPIITTTPNDGIEFKEAMEAQPGPGHQRLQEPRRRAGGAGRGGHAAHRVRRARGAGAVSGSGIAGTWVAAGRGPREPPLHSRARRRAHREGLRSGGGLLRRVPQPGGGSANLRPAGRDGRDAGTGPGPDNRAGSDGGRGGGSLQGSRSG